MLRAQGAYIVNNYLGKAIICDYLQIILAMQAWKRPFRTALYSKKTHFRALRARGASEANLFHDMIIFITRRFQRAIARPHQSTHTPNTAHNTFIII